MAFKFISIAACILLLKVLSTFMSQEIEFKQPTDFMSHQKFWAYLILLLLCIILQWGCRLENISDHRHFGKCMSMHLSAIITV